LNILLQALLKGFCGFLGSILEAHVVYLVGEIEKTILKQFELCSGFAHLVFCNDIY